MFRFQFDNQQYPPPSVRLGTGSSYYETDGRHVQPNVQQRRALDQQMQMAIIQQSSNLAMMGWNQVFTMGAIWGSGVAHWQHQQRVAQKHVEDYETVRTHAKKKGTEKYLVDAKQVEDYETVRTRAKKNGKEKYLVDAGLHYHQVNKSRHLLQISRAKKATGEGMRGAERRYRRKVAEREQRRREADERLSKRWAECDGDNPMKDKVELTGVGALFVDGIEEALMTFLGPGDLRQLPLVNRRFRAEFRADDKWKVLCKEHHKFDEDERLRQWFEGQTWYNFYFQMVESNREKMRMSNDLLDESLKILLSTSASNPVQRLQKLVSNGEKSFQFDVNYLSTLRVGDKTSSHVVHKSLLTLAILCNQLYVVQWLIHDKGVDVNCCGGGGEFSPLIYAAQQKDSLKMVECLLEKGADCEKKGFFGFKLDIGSLFLRASPESMDAEKWARSNDNVEVANMIQNEKLKLRCEAHCEVLKKRIKHLEGLINKQS
jgi:hypothetical protein